MRLIRTLAVLFVLAVSVASAEAASRVFVIHGIPGVDVDVYASAAGSPVPTTPTIPGFQPKQIVDVQAAAGAYDIRIFAQGANPQTDMPVIEVLGAAIPDNVS